MEDDKDILDYLFERKAILTLFFLDAFLWGAIFIIKGYENYTHPLTIHYIREVIVWP